VNQYVAAAAALASVYEQVKAPAAVTVTVEPERPVEQLYDALDTRRVLLSVIDTDEPPTNPAPTIDTAEEVPWAIDVGLNVMVHGMTLNVIVIVNAAIACWPEELDALTKA
jgi:hypothetical protein